MMYEGKSAAMNLSESNRLLNWTVEQGRRFGITAQSTEHRVHQLPWWDDQGLIRFIDEQPRERLRVFQSGTDPKHRLRDHQPVDTDGTNGAEILEAVKRGKLWVNLQRIDSVQPRCEQLGRQLYSELQEGAAHFRPIWINRAFLFISSPGAIVYLHADYQPNILWHLRGNKTIWIYPPYDARIVSGERIEEICAGGEDDIEFHDELDQLGQAFSIGPGKTVSWPARAPHRVVNGDNLNVSLSTFHETADDYAKVIEHRADYFFRTRLPAAARFMDIIGGSGKRLAYRALEKSGRVQGRPVKEFWARLRVDPEAPAGVREIPGGPVLTEHSRLVRAMNEHAVA